MDEIVVIVMFVACVVCSLALIGVSIFASYRCFRFRRINAGVGFLALITLWLTSHIPLPMVLFSVAYTETGGTNPGVYVVLLAYAAIAASLCYLVVTYLRKQNG